MPKNDSYKPRAGIQCHFLDDCQYTPCWGLVAFGSSGIYTCEGHRGVDAEGVGVYRLEPPKPPPAPEPEPEVLPGEYLPEPGSEKPMAVPTQVPWGDLSHPMLRGLHACVAECLRLCGQGYYDYKDSYPETFQPVLEQLYLEAWDELADRHLPALTVDGGVYPFVGADLASKAEMEMLRQTTPLSEWTTLQWAPFPEDITNLDLSGVPDAVVQVIYGCGAEVVDFSMLGNGTRQVVTAIWQQAESELDKREVEAPFLLDLKLDS